MERIKKLLSRLTKRATGAQGTLFLLFAIISLVLNPGSPKFWMFMIASIVFSALQTIIDQLKELKK